jgi:hypothetical protein
VVFLESQRYFYLFFSNTFVIRKPVTNREVVGGKQLMDSIGHLQMMLSLGAIEIAPGLPIRLFWLTGFRFSMLAHKFAIWMTFGLLK